MLRHAPLLLSRKSQTPKRVATVNRLAIDRGLFPPTETHGQEGADRGYQLEVYFLQDASILAMDRLG